jgi:hypothetical protein
MDPVSPRSPLVPATWLWILLTIAMLAAGPLLVKHHRPAATTSQR